MSTSATSYPSPMQPSPAHCQLLPPSTSGKNYKAYFYSGDGQSYFNNEQCRYEARWGHVIALNVTCAYLFVDLLRQIFFM